jgi:hypothetical protein
VVKLAGKALVTFLVVVTSEIRTGDQPSL